MSKKLAHCGIKAAISVAADFRAEVDSMNHVQINSRFSELSLHDQEQLVGGCYSCIAPLLFYVLELKLKVLRSLAGGGLVVVPFGKNINPA